VPWLDTVYSPEVLCMQRAVVLSLVYVLSCLLAMPASAAPCEVRLRVLSYNIHSGTGMDGELDLARTADAIRDTRADVVALQEVDVHWAARSDFRNQATDLARMLRVSVFFAPIYDLAPPAPGLPRRRYGVAVLSRFPLLLTENHEITRLSTQVPHAMPAPAPGFAEAVVLVRGEPVHVYCTHLDFRSDPAVRTTQVTDMIRIISGSRDPQLLLGDFNATPGAPELAPLWTFLTDAAPAGATFPANAPTERIDYVTVSSRVRVRSAAVPETLASDHRPVLAEVAVSP
jgi:endonuclease/exonuclease/phosphatase family metal-dependent hydrolase